ncbi:uncharacterized protein LOC126889891 [Diabrotica virgifera virgifera]|uniref:Uncharacterized protein n=1 Tax=Diabrotica virgifera virgifera TaxID=50390 RepID=A0ABM5KWJ1_DIAVI|nr:uncharacterized protein LOC126889891 [Diabrotica virgifera virgifera]
MGDYQEEVKNRSLAGNAAIGFFVVAFVSIFVAFATPSWLVSDQRITGAKLDRLGLWVHCFRSLSDPYHSDQAYRRFFVGCRWIYDPFTTGYDQIRGFLIPDFMIATQFFFTICFIAVLLGAIMSLIYFLCCGPEQKQFIILIIINSIVLFVGGIAGSIAVIVFACLANKNGWMPGHDNNFFGWSFALACIGVIACFVASVLFFVDVHVQRKKKRRLTESQSRFEMEPEHKGW